MDVTHTYNTQSWFTLANALKHAVEQENQQRPNGVEFTLRKPPLTRTLRVHNLMPASRCLASSSFLQLNRGARTYPQQGVAKQKQLT